MPSLPLRVLVRGSSIATQIGFWGETRADLAYPRVVEQFLAADGFSVTVHNRATIAERVSSAVRDWEAEVSTWSPDVVLLHYGYAEAIHLFLPRFVERHANSQQWRPTALNRAYRRWLLRPAWKAAATFQMYVDRVFPSRLTTRHRRVARDLAALIARVRYVVPGSLILVPELTSPEGVWQAWFPGMADRIRQANAAIEPVARSGDEDVRWVPTVDLVEQVRAEGLDPVPDGGHLSPQVHRLIARRIADEIADWARKQENWRV